MDITNLDSLAVAWAEAKAAEKEAVENRVAIEQHIIRVTGQKDEGSKTHTSEAGHKVTITARINRRLDAKKWAEIEPDVPEALRPVKYRPALDLKGIRYLKANEPEIYAICAQAFTTSPGKTGVKVVLNKEQ